MNKFFKIGMIVLVIVGIVFVLLLQIHPLVRYERRYESIYDLHGSRSQDQLKKIEENVNVFKTTGNCSQCDFGSRFDNDEKNDLRQVIQSIRSKGLSINLSQAFLTHVNLAGANLSGANLSDADLGYSDLTGANLIGANLSGASLYSINLTGADLTDANLSGVNLYGADLQKANLTGANLYKADLRLSNLNGANLTRANVVEALFMRTNVEGAILTGADLRGALIDQTDLTQVADITNAKLDAAIMRTLIVFSNWLNFVCSTMIPGIKQITKAIKLYFLYSKHWFHQKVKGGTPIPMKEWFEMQQFRELYPVEGLEERVKSLLVE